MGYTVAKIFDITYNIGTKNKWIVFDEKVLLSVHDHVKQMMALSPL